MSKARKSARQKTEISQKSRLVREFSDAIDEAAKALNLSPSSELQRFGLIFIDDRVWGSMQLTRFGFDLFSPLQKWTSPLEKRMTFGDHTLLIEISTYPYFIDSKTFTTFDPDLGMTMQFLKGDFEKLRRLR